MGGVTEGIFGIFTRDKVMASMLKIDSTISANEKTIRFAIMKYWKLESAFVGTCDSTFLFHVFASYRGSSDLYGQIHSIG